MVLIEKTPEVITGTFEPADYLAVFRKFSQDRMMQVHGNNLLNWFCNQVSLEGQRMKTTESGKSPSLTAAAKLPAGLGEFEFVHRGTRLFDDRIKDVSIRSIRGQLPALTHP
jgi:hypothetical protein